MKIKDIINKNVSNKKFVIYDEMESRYFNFWDVEKDCPEWVDDLSDDILAHQPVSPDELPMVLGTINECEEHLQKITKYYMNIDGECEGIVIKQVSLISVLQFMIVEE